MLTLLTVGGKCAVLRPGPPAREPNYDPKMIVEIIEPLDALTPEETGLLDRLLDDYGLARAGMVVYTVRSEHEPRYKLVAPHIEGVERGTTIELTVSAVGGRAWRSYYWEEGASPPPGADQPFAVLTIASGIEIVAEPPLGGR
jgi:hypothetical protein